MLDIADRKLRFPIGLLYAGGRGGIHQKLFQAVALSLVVTDNDHLPIILGPGLKLSSQKLHLTCEARRRFIGKGEHRLCLVHE